MKKICAAVALIASLGIAQNALAKVQTGNDFLRWAEEVQLAYVMGYWNAYMLLLASHNEPIPEGVTYHQMREAFRKWIREHPEAKNESMAELSADILGSFFPIKKRPPSGK